MSIMRIDQKSSNSQHASWRQSGARYMRGAKRAIFGLAAMALLATVASAQSTSTLNGRVSDPSGASVPSTKLTLTAASTGLQRTATSNSTGLYEFLDVPPGTYRLEATAPGFATFVAASLALVVNTPSTVNIPLQVTGVATSVTVEATVPLINRTDATLGNVLEQDQIAELPIADRNVVELLSLQPGVAYLGNNLDADMDTRSGAVNGMRSDQSNVTLDGIGVNDENNGYAFTGVLTMPPDSIEEFRVTTANANADSGYSSGAQVALVTKSGTNNFHGSAYEYNRNTVFSANDTFLKAAQGASGEPNQRPELLRNVFGATVGGPIKHNRIFFFLNYEGRRDAQGQSVVETVPTPSLRSGILEYQCTLLANGMPDTTTCPGGTVNGVSGIIPGDYALNSTQIAGMDPLKTAPGPGPNANVIAVLNQYPMPNDLTQGDGVNTSGYRFASKSASSFNTYISRLDWHITGNGNETVFWRGETQNNKQPQAQQFPGQPAASTLLDGSKGSTVGLTSVISPRLINNFHWGWIRQAGQNAGDSLQPTSILDGITSITPFTRSTIFIVPVNQLSDSLNWTRGNHSLQFGGDVFLIRNNHISYQNSFSDAQTNVVYLNTAGISVPGSNSPLNPGNNGYPGVDPGFAPSYDTATAILLGILAEGDGIYNFARNGTALAQGTPITRKYAVNDYEFFGQDSWRITPRLTFTYGLRWIFEAPPYETTGLQVSPCVEAAAGGCTNQNLADWFNTSAKLAAEGMPVIDAGEVTFVLGGPVNHGPGLWNWDHRDFSPRLAVAWAPDTGNGWISKILGTKDRFSLRAGYNIVYDHFGIPIVNTFDQNGSFGLSTKLGNPAGVVTAENAPRFTCLTCLPPPCASLMGAGCIFGPAPSGSFPVTPSNTAFAINWGLDQSLKTPYSHVYNFSLSRQITSNSSLQIAYVGTIGRRLPMQDDLAMPTNYTDPASKMTYFQAAKMLSVAVANGTPTSQIQKIPFWENTFPAWSTVTQSTLNAQQLNCAPDVLPGTLTATQAVYDLYSCFLHNETFALFLMDLPSSLTGVTLPNSKFGPNTFYHDQFASLYAWRNIGTSNYNALQLTYNIHWGSNLEGQFNYTFSKSLDEASAAQRIGPYEGTGGTGDDLNGGGIVINSYDPLTLRGLSDFNAAQQANANWVYHLPFGRGQKLVGSANPVLDAFIGGWHLSGVFRLTSGFPITVDNGPFWATNWNIEGDAMPNGPLPEASNPKNASVNGVPVGPDIFTNPGTAVSSFRQDWPGESGTRNNIIGAGIFNIDTGLSKDFSLGETRRLEFSWQTFNISNSVSYNVRGAQPSLGYAPNKFGLYSSTLTTPRFMQFALRFAF
jgi:hypothetical protein